MRSNLSLSLTVSLALLLGASLARAEEADFLTVVGSIDKVEKETLIVSLGDKSKKTVELKITGTSKFHLLMPQVRAGKTVLTQRSAEVADLEKGQSIAVIYAVADKENVLLTAVAKGLDKEKK